MQMLVRGLSGSELYLPYPSVGATEQAILAAVLADGVTVIHGQQRTGDLRIVLLFKWNGCCDLWHGNGPSDDTGGKNAS